ncbi:stage II sporulation protein M [Hwangdonia lutea]|uniref:Stage II sporulation protein M n=1 Tax=Hwangdonia lutea TaxID=3075823 RepID=A0AA97EMH7_9FLAO|nr:stage II sporulation protein M [Hwangdonia sp. SCSIO 19198]WOD44244.1 stage II sporulation protein M [Hwangdonia sp. SCSIO 19198]
MEEQKHSFKLSKVNWIFALIIIGISALFFLRKDGINAFSLGYLAGSIVTAGLIPLIIAFIVWLIRGKKKFAGTYTFNIVLVFMTFGMITEIGEISKEKSEGVEAISNSVSELKGKINNEEDVVTAFKEHSTNVDDGLSKLIRNSTGNEQEVYINLRKFTRINNAVMIDWQSSYDSVMSPRILDYGVLKNSNEYDYQIGVLENYKSQSIKYKKHFENRISIIADLFKNIPKENQTLKGVMKGITKQDSIQMPIFKPFIKSHLSYSENLIELVDFLEKNKMQWIYENDELIFDNTELENKYLEIIDNVAKDEENINILSDKLIDVM